MSRKLAIGALVGALLLSGLLVGVSYGGGEAITESRVIEMISAGAVRVDYPLRDSSGKRSGGISHLKEQLIDVDGDPAGTQVWDCFGSKVTDSCTNIVTLRSGPHAERGTVVITGIFRGFNGEKFAVTGGTGAYGNVRGYATLTVEGGEFVTTLYLTP